jgi:hypothetical protein
MSSARAAGLTPASIAAHPFGTGTIRHPVYPGESPRKGSGAAEFNDYIVVQKGSVLFQIWAANNGAHHLSYDQLEVVAKFLLTKIK